MHSFKTKFGSKQVERASQRAFDEVVTQAGKQTCKQGGGLGAIFCQLKDDGSRLVLTGTYLPPEWATKINEVLSAYKEEQDRERHA